MALSFPPDNYGIVTGAQTVPTGANGPGTVTVNAANLTLVVGSGTSFTANMKGSYILFVASGQLRYIEAVTEQVLSLNLPVAGALAAVNYQVTPPRYSKVVMVDLLAANNSTLTNPTSTAAQVFPDPPNEIVIEPKGIQGLAPVVLVNGLGTGIAVTVTL